MWVARWLTLHNRLVVEHWCDQKATPLSSTEMAMQAQAQAQCHD